MKILTGIGSKDHKNAISVLFQTTEWEVEELQKEDYRHRKAVQDVTNRYRQLRALVNTVLTGGANLSEASTRQERRDHLRNCKREIAGWVRRIAEAEAKAAEEREAREAEARKKALEVERQEVKIKTEKEEEETDGRPETDRPA